MLVTAIVGVYMLAFTLSDPSTLAALLKLGTWTPLIGVLGILAVQGLCSVAIIRYFRTEEPEGFHPVKTLIAPILGFLAMAGACYLLIDNRAGLSGAGDATYIKLVPWVVLVVFLIGCATALWMRSSAAGPLPQDRALRARGGRRGGGGEAHEHAGQSRGSRTRSSR